MAGALLIAGIARRIHFPQPASPSVILASFNYGRYGLAIGCGLWLAMPFLMVGWYILQFRAIVSGNRMPLWLLALVILYSFLPGALAHGYLAERGKLDMLFTLAAWVSMGGLAMMPLTITLELLKLRRDLKLTAIERRKRKM